MAVYAAAAETLVDFSEFNDIYLVIFAGATFVGTDLFNNKILVGDKLQPLQAKVLLLGESYTSQDIDDNVNLAEVLSEEERKVVRDRFLIWVLLITIIIVPTGAGILYTMYGSGRCSIRICVLQ